MSLPIERDARQADTWEQFVQAKNIADRTGARTDVEFAACAWRQWLIDFIPSPAEGLAVPLPKFLRGQS